MSSSPLVGPQQASDRNRSRIVLTLGQRGPLSRAELARLSGVSRTTIGSYVDRLIAEGVLEELDETVPATGPGRPSRPVWFDPNGALEIAVLFDEERIDAALVDARGTLRARTATTIPLDASTETIVDRVLELAGGFGGDDVRPLGWGLAVTGMVDEAGRLLSPLARFPGLDGTVLVDRLARATGVPIVIDNDSRAAALAELWWGQGRRHRSFWAVQIGEGIGGGEIVEGELARGSVGAAGEVGHMIVDRNGPECACGQHGCWETLASAHRLLSAAADRGLTDPTRPTDSNSGGTDEHARTAIADLVAAAETDPATRALIDEYADAVALGLANIVRLGDPALIVVQGEITAGGPALRDRITASLRRRSLLHDRHVPRLEFSDLGGDARLFGAAALVLAHTWALD